MKKLITALLFFSFLSAFDFNPAKLSIESVVEGVNLYLQTKKNTPLKRVAFKDDTLIYYYRLKTPLSKEELKKEEIKRFCKKHRKIFDTVETFFKQKFHKEIKLKFVFEFPKKRIDFTISPKDCNIISKKE